MANKTDLTKLRHIYTDAPLHQYNVVNDEDFGKGDADNTFENNVAHDFSSANNVNELKEQSATLTAGGYGIFAGTDPFVISGVPAGPVIERLDVPASAEAGGTMKVSVKISEAK